MLQITTTGLQLGNGISPAEKHGVSAYISEVSRLRASREPSQELQNTTQFAEMWIGKVFFRTNRPFVPTQRNLMTMMMLSVIARLSSSLSAESASRTWITLA